MAIHVVSTLKPQNGGVFPIVDAEDVEMPDGSRLDAMIPTVVVTEAEYEALGASGLRKDGVLYAVVPGGEDA